MDRHAITTACVIASLASGCSDPSPRPTDVTIRDAIVAPGDGGCSTQPFSTSSDDRACPVLGRDDGTCADLEPGRGLDGTLDGYAGFTDGDDVYVTPGNQGAQHIVVGFRGADFDPTNPIIEARLLDARDCNEVGYARVSFPFKPDPTVSGQLALEAIRVVMLDDHDPYEYCTVLGGDVTLVVNMDDRAGHRVHRERRLHVAGIDPTVRPDLHDAWVAACVGHGRDGGTP